MGTFFTITYITIKSDLLLDGNVHTNYFSKFLG